MNILPYKRVRVAERLTVKVSNHFHYSDFGVRDGGAVRYTGRRYVASATPGTGFLERESESHSYREFVRRQVAAQRPRWWRMALGLEPSYDAEMARVSQALADCSDPRRRDILECYLNALSVGRSEEKLQRIVRGIKDKIGHHSNKYLVSVLSHYKNKLARLQNDMLSVSYNVKDHCPPSTYEAYLNMVDAFTRMASCHRIWHYTEQSRERYSQVFFDLGVFDFIRAESYLPILRDSAGIHYYLLPGSVVVARSSVDFDLVPLRDLTVVCQDLAIEEPVDVLSSHLGDAASMIRIPDLGLSFYFNHVRAVQGFVSALDALKATL